MSTAPCGWVVEIPRGDRAGVVRMGFPALLNGSVLAPCTCGGHFRHNALEADCPHCGAHWRFQIVPLMKSGKEPATRRQFLHCARLLLRSRIWAMEHARYLRRCKQPLASVLFWARLANHVCVRCLVRARELA